MEGIKRITVDDFSTINRGEVIHIYSKFGLTVGADDNSNRKIAIVNREKGTCTKPFVDEVIYSSVPLRSWTENYIVVRIAEKYYLADCDGNCFAESHEMLTICRNGFVSTGGGESVFINNKLEYGRERVKVYSNAGYHFAYVVQYNSYDILGSDGSVLISIQCKSGSDIDFGTLPSYFVFQRVYKSTYIINKSFDAYYTFRSGCCLRDKYSMTYGYNNENYSAYLGMNVSNIFKFDNAKISIIIANGKAYIFHSDGTMKTLDTLIKGIKKSQNRILYRDDNEIVEIDLNGVELRREVLSPKELYFLLMNEKND